jgi:hypothetical protein
MSGYEYEAEFSNGFNPPAVTKAAMLTVGTATTVTANPSSALINIGGTVSFSAAATGGFPTPAIQWDVNENNGFGFTPITNGSYYSGANTNTLTITGVTSFMNGYEYEATYTNALNTATSTSATLSDLGLVLTEGPNVLLYSISNKLVDQFAPFGNSVTSVQAAVGNVLGGPNADLVVASGPGGGTINVYNGLTGTVAQTITPYNTYTKGVTIALGNVLTTNTSNVDIVVAPGGSGRVVKVYNYNALTSQMQYDGGFYPFPSTIPNASYTGGLHVAVGNLSGSGKDTIVLGTASPQPAEVNLWTYNGSAFVQGKLLSYSGKGANVATLATTPGGIAELIVGTQNLSSSALYVKTGTGAAVSSLPGDNVNIFDYGNTGDVIVGAMDVFGDGTPDIVVATGSGSTQEVRVFSVFGNTVGLEETLDAAELGLAAGYNGGLYVG